jgi:hypothetical protein
VKIVWGADTIMYGPPDAYVLRVVGRRVNGPDAQVNQIIAAQLFEQVASPWNVLWFITEKMTTLLREAEAEPEWWDCGGAWFGDDNEEWSPEDEFGDYKW